MFFDVTVFLLSSLSSGASFSMSLPVLEFLCGASKGFMKALRQSVLPKSDIHPSEFCPISGDWGELRIPNLPRMALMKS